MEKMSYSFIGKGFGDMKQKITEQFAEVKTSVEQSFDFENMNCAMPDMTGNLEEMTNFMQMGGTDAGNAFADALQGTSGTVQAAVQSINNIIQNTLIKKEDMFLWGGNLMQSFINGMNSQKGALMMAASSLATVIGDYLKVQSPSRKGGPGNWISLPRVGKKQSADRKYNIGEYRFIAQILRDRKQRIKGLAQNR